VGFFYKKYIAFILKCQLRNCIINKLLLVLEGWWENVN